MKKFSLSLLMVVMAMIVSCSSDDDEGTGTEVDLNLTAQRSDDHVNVASLPQAIFNYITANYPGSTIWKAEIEDNNNYEVELNTGVELIFDQEGNFLGVDDDADDDFGDEHVAPANLPEKIRNFVTTHFAGATIIEAEKENNGNYEIELSNDVELVFDADGNFLGKAEDDEENDDLDDEDIEISQLPQAVRDYISANYPDNTIIEAELEDDGKYEVTLNDGTELYFDAAGNFLSAEDKNGDDDDDGDDDGSDD